MQRREECADLPMDLNQLQDKFIHDLFVSEGLGAVIDEAEYGYAKCSMVIEPRHCNALGIPMGGTIFTLADFAFAVASNQNGRDVVTQASQITFLKSAKGKQKWPSSPSMAMWSVTRGKGNLPLCCSEHHAPTQQDACCVGAWQLSVFSHSESKSKARKVSISSRRGPLSIFQRGGRSTPLSNPNVAMAALMGMGLTWEKSACIRGR